MFRLLLLLLLPAMGSTYGAVPDSTVTLVLESFGRTSNTHLAEEIQAECNRAFIKRHPHIRISIVQSLRLKNQTSFDAVRMALAGASAPDIIQVPVRNCRQLMEQGFAAPLEGYLDAWSRTADIDRILPPSMRPAVSDNEHIYFIPDPNPRPTLLLYRKDRFAEAGLSHPPRTWDQLVSYARALTDTGDGRYGLVLFGHPSSPAWRFSIFLWQAGGSWFRREADGTWRANLDTPEAESALRLYYRLLAEPWERNGRTMRGAAHIVGGYFMDQFRSGHAAMIFADRHLYTSMDPNLVGAAPMPAGPGGRRATELGGGFSGINNQITDPRRRDAAWEYLRFRYSRAADSIRTAVKVKAGLSRFVDRPTLDRFGFSEYTGLPRRTDLARAEKVSRRFGRPEASGPEGAFNIYGRMAGAIYDLTFMDGPEQIRPRLARVNRTLERFDLNYVPPAEQTRRNRITALILAVLGTGMAGLLVFQGLRAITAGSRGRVNDTRPSTHLWAWAFILPAAASMLLWGYYPLIRGLLISCMDYRVNAPGAWVGIGNFATALWRPSFWQAFARTLYYVGLTLLLGYALPVVLAVLFNEIPAGASLFRTICYIPAVISALVVSLTWMEIFKSGSTGFLNRLATGLGLPPQQWLDNPRLAMLCVVIPGIWAAAGAGSILYQAALGSIHPHLYEQADIDGAGWWHKLRHITLASLRPLLVIQLVGTVIGAFHATQRILVMTGGGPDGTTHTLGVMIFRESFEFMRFGYATAVAWITGAFLISFTVLQLRLFRRMHLTMGRH